MARGKSAEVGATRVADNGYHYTKTDAGWRLTHHIIAENTLGRTIKPDERVVFKNGKRSDLTPDNILVTEKGRGAVRRRKIQLEGRIADLIRELNEIELELETDVTWSLRRAQHRTPKNV